MYIKLGMKRILNYEMSNRSKKVLDTYIDITLITILWWLLLFSSYVTILCSKFQTLLCNDTGGPWDIPWPFNYGFIRLHIVPHHLRPKSNFGVFQIEIQPVLDKSLHMPSIKNRITHKGKWNLIKPKTNIHIYGKITIQKCPDLASSSKDAIPCLNSP